MLMKTLRAHSVHSLVCDLLTALVSGSLLTQSQLNSIGHTLGLFELLQDDIDQLYKQGHNHMKLTHFATKLLNLALISYTAAHNEEFLPNPLEGSLFISADFPGARCLALFYARGLNCLNAFLKGRRVYVFASKVNLNDHLYLSASIRAIRLVWGPVWRISNSPEQGNSIIQYNMGNGSVVPWSEDQSSEREPNEALAHFLPFSLIGEHARMQSDPPTDGYVLPFEELLEGHGHDRSEQSRSSSDSLPDDPEPEDLEFDQNKSNSEHDQKQIREWIYYAAAHPFVDEDEALLIGAGTIAMHHSSCKCSIDEKLQKA